MAKTTKKEYDEIIAQKKALAKIILKRIGLKYEDFIIEAEASLLHEYADLITPEEKEKYNKVVFYDTHQQQKGFHTV